MNIKDQEKTLRVTNTREMGLAADISSAKWKAAERGAMASKHWKKIAINLKPYTQQNVLEKRGEMDFFQINQSYS